MLPQNVSGIFKVMSLGFVDSEQSSERGRDKQKRRRGTGIRGEPDVKGIPTPVSEGTQTFCKGNTGAPVH